LLSTESILIEILSTRLELDALVIAANSIPMAGAVLLLITTGTEKKKAVEVFKA
jgi:hypothetical protein